MQGECVFSSDRTPGSQPVAPEAHDARLPRIRVAVVCYPSLGGSGVLASELARALAARGHVVHVVSPEPPFRLRSHRRRAGLFLHRVPVPSHPLLREGPYGLALAGTLSRLVSRWGLDVVHVHYALPHAPAAVLARAMSGGFVRVVTTLHGTDVSWAGREPTLRQSLSWALAHSDAVTAVSRALAREASRRYGLTGIKLVPNFVDLTTWRPHPAGAVRRRFAGEDDLVLVHASNFRSVKRAPDTVDILTAVRRQRPATLLLVGDGPDRNACLERARTLGVLSHVHVLGTRADLPRLLPAADVFLLPSREESFGLSALEAMACGVPVVASRVGGLPEVVRDGVTGYLLPVGDTEAMARAVLSLSDPERRASVGAAARAWAATQFSQEAVVPLYERIYAQTLATPPRS